MGKQMTVKKGGDVMKGGDYRKQLAKYAQDDRAREPAGGVGNKISIKGKRFSFRGESLPEPLKVIIVDYGFENAYYDTPYDPDNVTTPACFALGKTEDGLAPHESSPKPQAKSCAECEHNVFGSAERGKGKACKNGRRLAVLSADVKTLDAGYVQKSDPALLILPPASLKNFKGHVKKLTEAMQLPLFAAVTSLEFDEEAEGGVLVPHFEAELANDRKLLNALVVKRDEVQDMLLAPYDPSSYSDSKSKGGKGGKKNKDTGKPGKRARF